MKRTNTFEARPHSEIDEEVLHRLLDASASLWNELTYERRQRYFDGENVWEADSYYDRYKGVLGAATIQQVTRKNDSAWRSFFTLLEDQRRSQTFPDIGETKNEVESFGRTSGTTITRSNEATDHVSRSLSVNS